MKRPERELLAQERKRLKRKEREPKPKSKLGPFAIAARIFSVVAAVGLVLLVAATFFTPLLAIEEIKVSGTDRLDEKKISKALATLEGRPLTTITDGEIETLLANFPLIETFATQAQPPHTLIVKIRERQPIVALVRGGKNYLYDAAGVQIEQTTGKIKVPFLNISGNPTDNPQFELAVELLLSLPVETFKQIYSVEVSQNLTGKFVLRDSNITVIWGSSDDSLLKDKVLNSLLKTGLDDSVVVDVSSPNAPVVTYPNY